jgi:hypothetical protein
MDADPDRSAGVHDLPPHDAVSQHGQAAAGRDLVAVPEVSAHHPAPGRSDAGEPAIGGSESAGPPAGPPAGHVPPARCWEDGWRLYYNHVVQVANHGRLYRFRDGPRGRVGTIVGIVSDPIKGTSVWHYARCTCDAGNGWGWPCAHKAASFILARAQQQLPPGFPDF